MRLLVTGGFGFIGRAVMPGLLDAGHDVTVLAHSDGPGARPSDATLVTGDLRDDRRLDEIVRDGGFDAVVHLGGLTRPRESFERPLDYFDVNVAGTVNLLRALQRHSREHEPPRVVYASTTLVYGSRVGAVDEDAALSPESPYAETKVSVERLITAHAETGAIGATVLRIFNVGGGIADLTDTDPSRIIPTLLDVAAGARPDITLVGGGAAVCDFVHIADVATAVRAALDKAHAGACPTYNIGSGVGSTILELIRCVEEVTGRPIPVKYASQGGTPPRLIADISAACSELNWKPERSDLRSIVADSWMRWPGRR